MTKLKKIYFDGKGYAQDLIDRKNEFSQEEVDIANKLNFTPIDSISFENYQEQTYCDIKIGDNYFEAISIEYLYTSITKKTKTILYPSHNPTPNPGALY